MTKKTIRLSWVTVVLLLGHLILIAELWVSARSPRQSPTAGKPGMSILEGLGD